MSQVVPLPRGASAGSSPRRSFEQNFLMRISLGLCTLSLALLALYMVLSPKFLILAGLSAAPPIAIASWALARTNRVTLSANVLLFGMSVVELGVLYHEKQSDLAVGFALSFLFLGVASVLLRGWNLAAFVLFHAFLFSVVLWGTIGLERQAPDGAAVVSNAVSLILIGGTMCAGIGLFVGRYHENLATQQRLLDKTRETASGLAAATGEIGAMSRKQEEGAVNQASAVAEIRQTLDALTQASADIAESTRDVLENAEATLHNNELIGTRIAELTGHTRRIGELLEIIKDVANKSELLALNASLEGAKAGEAGRGFSLVAARMQRLAENVMDSVADVKSLITDIQGAMDATVIATETGTKVAAGTTDAARRITLITQQQSSSTAQVADAMEDIAMVAAQVASGCTQTFDASRDLATLAGQLEALLEDIGDRQADVDARETPVI